mmetsp:Transcript_409/g.1555  ORF Transcript_409/g.1555 Transcript_409/m.1555 type:complete len:1126 (-) Transcript_409:47-3424(-)
MGKRKMPPDSSKKSQSIDRGMDLAMENILKHLVSRDDADDELLKTMDIEKDDWDEDVVLLFERDLEGVEPDAASASNQRDNMPTCPKRNAVPAAQSSTSSIVQSASGRSRKFINSAVHHPPQYKSALPVPPPPCAPLEQPKQKKPTFKPNLSAARSAANSSSKSLHQMTGSVRRTSAAPPSSNATFVAKSPCSQSYNHTHSRRIRSHHSPTSHNQHSRRQSEKCEQLPHTPPPNRQQRLLTPNSTHRKDSCHSSHQIVKTRHFTVEDDFSDDESNASHSRQSRNPRGMEQAQNVAVSNTSHLSSPTHRPIITRPFSFHPIHRHLYPHQIEAVEFLHSNLSQDLGCMLCDHMGLGKTISCLSYIAQFCVDQPRQQTSAQRILVIVPASVIGHWGHEIDKVNEWLHELHRPRILYSILNYASKADRQKMIKDWYNNKKVLFVTYSLFRNLMLIRQDGISDFLAECDCVFLDEGHRIKNTASQISRSLQYIDTNKRIVCTGYPMQNNLMEYWAIADFARPGALGDFEDYQQAYVDPIEHGLSSKSSVLQKKDSRGRAWLLHEAMKPFVLRRDVSILKDTLPPKREIFITVHPTYVQRELINNLCQKFKEMEITRCYFWFYNIIGICMNHPDILMNYLCKRERHLTELSREIMKNRKNQKIMTLLRDAENERTTARHDPDDSDSDEDISDIEIAYQLEQQKVDLLKSILTDYETGDLFASNKMLVLFRLIFQCKLIGDKIAVFTKSLATLSFIEDCINEHNCRSPRSEITFVRLDGSTQAHKRHALVKKFSEEKIDVALISTLAGGEGINLTAANRIVIMDVNFNPSHDVEACCRVYRYGQTREVYVYRLIGYHTAEHRVINAQLRKERLADWIVDDGTADVEHIRDKHWDQGLPHDYKETPLDIPPDFDISFDPLLQNIAEKYKNDIHSLRFHDTLLFSNELMELSSTDKEKARLNMRVKKSSIDGRDGKDTAANDETISDDEMGSSEGDGAKSNPKVNSPVSAPRTASTMLEVCSEEAPLPKFQQAPSLRVDTSIRKMTSRGGSTPTSTVSVITPRTIETSSERTPVDCMVSPLGSHNLVEKERFAMLERLKKNAKRNNSSGRKRKRATPHHANPELELRSKRVNAR